MVAGCIFKHPKQIISDFLDKHLLPLLEKSSHENMQILIVRDFNINFLTTTTKILQIFLKQCFTILIYLLLTHPLE